MRKREGGGWRCMLGIHLILSENVVINGEENEDMEYIAEWVMYEDAENRVKGTYVVSVIKVGYGGKN